MIYVIAASELNEGCKEKFIAAAKANIPNVLAEAGCIMYVLNEDFPSGLSAQKEVRPDVVTFLECWESIEHLRQHLQAPHMAEFRTRIAGMRKSSSLQVVTPV